jgi:DNA-binding NtrC family response regulator
VVPYILLIEDDALLRAEMSEYLTRRNNNVRACGTVAEASQALRERRPDVVVADVNLPDGDGAVFCVNNASRHPKTKWLLMSGDPNLVNRSQKLKRDPDAPPFSVMSKPVPMHYVVEFVRLAMMANGNAAT